MPELDLTAPRTDLFRETPRGECIDGSGFAAVIKDMTTDVPREKEIFKQLLLGNIPEYLRIGLPVTVYEDDHSATFWTMPDYLSIGDDDDFLRMPMRPTTAQKASELFNATLPTRKMANAIRDVCAHKPGFQGMAQFPMMAVPTFQKHQLLIQRELEGKDLQQGVDGCKKTVIIARKRPKPNVAIYGGYFSNGRIVQGPQIQMSAHTIPYLDYSHGIRLVSNLALVDDKLMYIEEVLTDPVLHVLLSDEGVYAEGDTKYSMEI